MHRLRKFIGFQLGKGLAVTFWIVGPKSETYNAAGVAAATAYKHAVVLVHIINICICY